MLKAFYQSNNLEAGCDEAGRGCLAGPVFAAAVILPTIIPKELKALNDSKKINAEKRQYFRSLIENYAEAFAVSYVDNTTIDKINILNASILAMHLSLEKLPIQPKYIIVDGNRFKPYKKIPYTSIVKGDGKYLSIAAASILAKTYRDEFVEKMHNEFPVYGWNKNKTYATAQHRDAISKIGQCHYHRKSFILKSVQTKFDFEG